MHPYHYACGRAQDIRKLTLNNARMVVREMVEDGVAPVKEAVNYCCTAFQLGLVDQATLREEALQRFSEVAQ